MRSGREKYFCSLFSLVPPYPGTHISVISDKHDTVGKLQDSLAAVPEVRRALGQKKLQLSFGNQISHSVCGGHSTLPRTFSMFYICLFLISTTQKIYSVT